MKIWKRTPSRGLGLTLVELAIGMTLVAMILGTTGMITLSSVEAYQSHRDDSRLDALVRRTLDRMASELRMVQAAGLSPSPTGQFGTSQLEYQENAGFSSGTITWGPATSIELVLEPGEIDDDVDNDGDGLIDESVVRGTRNVNLASETSVVWANGVTELLEGETANGLDDNQNGVVDERGLSFHLVGTTLFIRLSMQAVRHDGRVSTRTMETSIRIRN